MKSKFKIGQTVLLNGKGRYKIEQIEKHGLNICMCCGSEPYFMYRLGPTFWANQNQLRKVTKN